MKKIVTLMLSLSLIAVTAGCGTKAGEAQNGSAAVKTKDTLTIAWYPNESGAEMKSTRDEIGKVVAAATGKKVEHKTTTDYTIAIEAIASGSADIVYTGAQGYVEANKKNPKVLPLVIPSGESGTLEDAVYYSWLNVRKGEEQAYKSGDGYSIDNIAGKKFSFVSNSSTSGFKIPSAGIVNYFSKKEKTKNLTVDDLILGGKNNFFSEVLFGGTHQGSAMNLLMGKADVSAFCDTCVANYVELSSGKANTPGAVYKVKQGASEPFNTMIGKEFTLISVTPVLNQPFAINTGTVSAEDKKKLVDTFTSDAVTNNPLIFLPKDSKETGMFKQKSGKERFLTVDDGFFSPVRMLSN
ncbi:phosphate/phosphite/phosphonate ABC transporter substrate-binding protein [Paenibacillus sp. CGMCC 1.16610]|uniref:PhnD/SsuA/transferrin family substrate-binding protein n=1 Tax=Paenibacillus anseongense TaxID=2682845 RepID=A0ABW9U5L7_9BACL|nr:MULTISPECIES: phosphate/phosphite/phosphonate ABC transporter substrate-binding protein [Paenibacillus]MBA2938789.1 phosphate/phosphite/phosphonate ABC transporter substrate-binding protein [Paenibacillus sp. CGMCC 1.16610]MVQ34751.1 PhnD/SsuA/transferrin family substrate-binding protein [Paenibacillus anseongense]